MSSPPPSTHLSAGPSSENPTSGNPPSGNLLSVGPFGPAPANPASTATLSTDSSPDLPSEIQTTSQQNSLAEPGTTPTTALIKRTRAQVIFEKIRLAYLGRPTKVPAVGTVRLRESEYKLLLRLLDRDKDLDYYAFRHLKLSYSTQRRKLAYQMPTLIHDLVAESVNDAIKEQLKAIASSDERAPEVIDQLRSAGTARITYEHKASKTLEKRHPDGSWRFRGSPEFKPCFILEVAYSQTAGNAKDKIVEMMESNKGRLGLALLLKMEYATPQQLLKPATTRAASYTLFFWTHGEDEDGEECYKLIRPYTKFRKANGTAVPGTLSFSIRDFIGAENYEYIENRGDPAIEIVLDQGIVLDHEAMVGWAREAEEDTIRDMRAHSAANKNDSNTLDKRLIVEPNSDSDEKGSVGDATSDKSSSSDGSSRVSSNGQTSSGKEDVRDPDYQPPSDHESFSDGEWSTDSEGDLTLIPDSEYLGLMEDMDRM